MRRGWLASGIAATLARVLLFLYPPSFRKDVGDALVGDVRRRAEALAGVRVGGWLVRLAISLLFNAIAAWGGLLIRRRRRLPGSSPFSWLDLKLAFRMLAKYPGLTLTGGLGIAVAVAIGVGFFTVLQSRFAPVIPLNEGDRMVVLSHWDRRTNNEARRSLYDFAAWREGMKSVEDVAAFRTVTRNVIGQDGSVELVRLAEITPSGFRLARVPPLLGRSLVEGDAAPGAPPVIVIGLNVWRTRFASAPGIVGRDLRLGRTVHTIVGVMPDRFAFPVNHRYWIPLKADPAEYERGKGASIFVAGRLAPGFGLAAAQAELTTIGKRMAAEFPDTHGDLRPEVLPYGYMNTGMTRSSANGWWAMAVLASLLLVVVCVNVAILVYARTATRMGEIAVRSALGASRARIVAQLSAESFVLSAGAAAAGLLAVKLLFDEVVRAQLSLDGISIGGSAFWQDYSLSGSALVYFVALTALAALITGVIPALRATGRRVQPNLRHVQSGAGLRLGRTWTTLIVVQVAVASAALPLAVALGWLEIRGAFRVPNFPVEQIAFTNVGLQQETPAPPGHFARLQTELAVALDAEPGLISHSFTLDLPGVGDSARVAVENDLAGTTPEVERSTVDLDFLRTFDLGVLAGRPFRAGDRDEHSADVVLVNRAFAARVLGGSDPLGRRIRFISESPRDPGRPETERWYEIVGVVENIDANPYGANLVDLRVYHPMKSVDGAGVGLAVRAAGIEQATLARRLREIAAAIDPALTVDVRPMERVYRVLQSTLRTAAIGIGLALLSVLLLSAAGIYALMSFSVTQRRREIAIRTALGAQRGRLLGAILGRALRQMSLGVAIGVGAALLIDGTSQGEALSGNGVPLLATMVMVMSVVGLFAAIGPARRGLRIAPSEALKGE